MKIISATYSVELKAEKFRQICADVVPNLLSIFRDRLPAELSSASAGSKKKILEFQCV